MLPERDTGGKSGQRPLICPLRSSKVKGQGNQCGRGRPPAKGLKKTRRAFDLPVNGGRSSGHSVYYSLGSGRKEGSRAGAGPSHGQGHTWLCGPETVGRRGRAQRKGFASRSNEI